MYKLSLVSLRVACCSRIHLNVSWLVLIRGVIAGIGSRISAIIGTRIRSSWIRRGRLLRIRVVVIVVIVVLRCIIWIPCRQSEGM